MELKRVVTAQDTFPWRFNDMNSCVEKKKENDEVDGCVCPISILFHFHVAYIIIYHIILFNSTYIDACRVG